MSRLPPPFGPFHPLRRLGAGGMAETFVAVRRGPGGFEQRVCIKRILPAFESDQEFVESFLQEARTSAALRHGNIVQVLDFGLADDTHYLALELIEGLDLRALLGSDSEQRVALDPELTTLIAADLCAALEHAHSDAPGRASVVHRDVSPSNVLVSTAGEVKLTDFGIARATSGRHRTASGIIKGKVPYMPPEYIERGIFDPRGDLFSLGVLLYEVMAGERPFDGHSDLDTIRRIVAGQHTHLGALARSAPPQLVQCVERLLAVNPDQRYASARAVLEALPEVASHRIRGRLGALVRERLREAEAPPDPMAGTLRHGLGPDAMPPMTPAAYTPGPAASPQEGAGESAHAPLPRTHTRAPLLLSSLAGGAARFETDPATQTRGSVRRPSSRAWWALSSAGLCLCGVLALWIVRSPSAVPTIPVSASIPEPEPAETKVAVKAPPATAKPHDGWEEVSPPATPAGSLSPSRGEDPLPVEPPAPSLPSAPVRSHRSRAPRAAPPTSQPRQASPDQPAELTIFVQPFGDVWIDGKRQGQAPVTVKLPAGEHEIGVGDGRPKERRTVQLEAGQSKQLEIHRRDLAEAAE